jgi:hypothetical protein
VINSALVFSDYLSTDELKNVNYHSYYPVLEQKHGDIIREPYRKENATGSMSPYWRRLICHGYFLVTRSAGLILARNAIRNA